MPVLEDDSGEGGTTGKKKTPQLQGAAALYFWVVIDFRFRVFRCLV